MTTSLSKRVPDNMDHLEIQEFFNPPTCGHIKMMYDVGPVGAVAGGGGGEPPGVALDDGARLGGVENVHHEIFKSARLPTIRGEALSTTG